MFLHIIIIFIVRPRSYGDCWIYLNVQAASPARTRHISYCCDSMKKVSGVRRWGGKTWASLTRVWQTSYFITRLELPPSLPHHHHHTQVKTNSCSSVCVYIYLKRGILHVYMFAYYTTTRLHCPFSRLNSIRTAHPYWRKIVIFFHVSYTSFVRASTPHLGE